MKRSSNIEQIQRLSDTRWQATEEVIALQWQSQPVTEVIHFRLVIHAAQLSVVCAFLDSFLINQTQSLIGQFQNFKKGESESWKIPEELDLCCLVQALGSRVEINQRPKWRIGRIDSLERESTSWVFNALGEPWRDAAFEKISPS